MASKNTIWLVLGALSLFLQGCTASLANLESPRVLRPGQVSPQMGAVFYNAPTPTNDAGVKVGIVRRLEAGIKTDLQSGTLLLRYQLLDTPFVAIGLENLGIQDKAIVTFGQSEKSGHAWSPSILIGRDFWYFGAKATYSLFDAKIAGTDPSVIFVSHKWNSVAIIGGIEIRTDYVNILLECDEYIPRMGKRILVPAIGLSGVL
jgi:hypothetical protein